MATDDRNPPLGQNQARAEGEPAVPATPNIRVPKMHSVRDFLEHWRPAIELGILAVAVVAAFIAGRSDATFKNEEAHLGKATELLEQFAQVSKDQANSVAQMIAIENKRIAIENKRSELDDKLGVVLARGEFDNALNEAEKYCCQTCGPNYLLEASLTKALQAEEEAEPLLSAADYNRLALYGSSVWKVSTTEKFANKALHHPDCTPIDQFYSQLILGHAKFSLLPKGAEFTRVNGARKEFRKAAAMLETESTTDDTRVHVGECYAVWAANEGYLGYSSESKEAWQKAVNSWSPLANAGELKTAWDAWVKGARNGYKPSISYLF